MRLLRWHLRAVVWCGVAILTSQLSGYGQTIIKSFAGVSLIDTSSLGTGATPPDTMGAAGTNHFVEFVNGAFSVYGKDGTQLMLISDIAFWENAGISSATISAGLSDPRVAYDPPSGRWFGSEITVESTANHILVARSDTSDPTGTWKAVFFTATTGGFDYDTLGVDANAVYLGANVFSGGGSYLGDSFFCIPKADLVSNTPSLANMTRFNSLKSSTYGFTLQPVSNPFSTSGHGVIIAIDNSASLFVNRTTVNNPGHAGATLSTRVRIPIAFDSPPNPAEQPGGNTVDTVDYRFTGAVREVGSNMFMAHTILQGSRDAVHWIVINESNNAVVGEGLISDPNFDFFQPTIAANPEGQIVMGFNRSGSTAPGGDISIFGALGRLNAGSVSMGAPFLIDAGTANNFGPNFDSAAFRWGDYSATTADPTDDNLFWTIQEIPVDNNNWGTQITLISLATNAPSLAITPMGTNVVITWPLSTDPAYVLQSTPSLLPSAWTPVAAPIAAALNQNVVTLAIQPNGLFFRLKR